MFLPSPRTVPTSVRPGILVPSLMPWSAGSCASSSTSTRLTAASGTRRSPCTAPIFSAADRGSGRSPPSLRSTAMKAPLAAGNRGDLLPAGRRLKPASGGLGGPGVQAGRADLAEVPQARHQADGGVRVAVGDQGRAHLPVICLEDRIEFGAVTGSEHLQREGGVGRIVVRTAHQGERPDADPLALVRGQRAVSIPQRIGL